MCRAIRWGGRRVFQMPILSTELFNRVQVALRNNANNKSETHGSPNLLSGKLFSHNEVRFTNQRTCGKGKTNTHYYATRDFYPPAIVDVLKRINIHDVSYAEKKAFIQSLVDKIIYSQEKLIFYLTPDTAKLQTFVTDNFINQKSDPMEFTVGDNRIVITVPIVLRKYVNTVFDKFKNGVLTITDNNHLIVKAFATAWKYRDMYEECGDVDKIIISPRQFYRYLDLAYMNPDKVNEILSGEMGVKVNDLFRAARENQLN